MIRLLSLIVCAIASGCAGSQPRITGFAIVGGSQMNNDNFFGNFYERDKIFNRQPGMIPGNYLQERLDGRQALGIGFKVRGEW